MWILDISRYFKRPTYIEGRLILPVVSMSLSKLNMTIEDLRRCARSERHSHDAVFRMKWPRGFRCSNCACRSHRFLPKRPKVIECLGCHRQETLTSGTFFQGTRKDLRLWFRALILVLTAKGPISATRLKKHLDLSTYQTAWTWLRKVHALIETTAWAARLRRRLTRATGPSVARVLWAGRHASFRAWATPGSNEIPSTERSARFVLPALWEVLPPRLRSQPFPTQVGVRSRRGWTLSLKHFPGHLFCWLFPRAVSPEEALCTLLRALTRQPSMAGWRLIGRESAGTLLLVSST